MTKRPILCLFILLTLISVIIASTVFSQVIKLTPYDPKVVSLELTQLLKNKGLKLGAPIFIRIFKQSNELEVWVEKKDGTYGLFETYPICYYSGELGPKQKEGDRQAPEGFYTVTKSQMNPHSSYHLSFNLGYPNKYDKSHGRTGSYLMVHGNCVSIGCYAMTDEKIEKIYTLADHALKNGQKSFSVHAFPFRMTDNNMKIYKNSKWQQFWKNLKEGYDIFENTKRIPKIEVKNKLYVVK